MLEPGGSRNQGGDYYYRPAWSWDEPGSPLATVVTLTLNR